MRKLLYMIGLCTLAAACTEDYTDWASPLTNPQEKLDSVECSILAPTAINVADIEGDSLTLFTADYAEEFDEVSYSMELANAATGSKATITPDADGRVSVADLQAALAAIYGLRPVERSVAFNLVITAKKDGAGYRMSKTGEIGITPKAPVIEEAYYYVGALNNWSDSDQTYKLTNGGGDVYDDPVFTVVIPVPTDATGARVENWFKIAPASAYTREEGFWGGDMVGAAVNGQSDFEGSFIVGQNDDVAQAFNIGDVNDEALYYRLEFNMLEQTYKVVAVGFNEFIYEIGGESGWSTPHALKGNDEGQYAGFYYLDSEYKFKPKEADWNGDYEKKSGDAYSGAIDDIAGGSNIDAPAAGFYKIEVDLKALTYKLTAISTIGIIGNGGDWNNDIDMAYNTALGCWEATATLAAGTFKFRANHDWAINWGGSFDDLSQDGANLSVAAAGEYTVRLFLSYDGAHYCTLTTGDEPAVVYPDFYYEIGGESSWSTSHALKGNGIGQYTGIYYLNDQFKFKPNADNWDNDLEKASGDAYEGTLGDIAGGANVDAPAAGAYIIDLDVAALTYKLTAVSVSIIGNGGDWNNDIDMAYDTSLGCFAVTTELAAGTFKFRANHDWAINWGGTFGNLTQDGDNLSIAEAGTYTVQLFLSYAGAHYCTLTKQ